MQGGLLKSASAVAIIAAAGLFGASPAKAADLGGDCCADLEERVAELEATTMRKGNRKVSLTVSGYVSSHVMYWNDGTQNDVYIGDGGAYGSRFRFVGEAKINPQLSAGFLYEFQSNANVLGSFNQLNGGDNVGNTGATGNAGLNYAGCGSVSGTTTINSTNSVGCPVMRDATVWLKHSQLGMVKIGHGSTATDNLILIDLGGASGGSASSPDVGLFMGGFILRGKNGILASNATNAQQYSGALNWTAAIRGHESFDTFRRNNVLVESPTIMGFSLQAAIAQDNFWDIAGRYAGEFQGIRVAAGFGYSEDTGLNGPYQTGVAFSPTFGTAPNINTTALSNVNGQNGNFCSANCDVKSADWKGSFSGIHVPTGLYLTGAYGNRHLTGTQNGATATAYSGPDLRMFYLNAGMSKNLTGLGNTIGYLEYSEHRGGLAQASFLGITSGTNGYCTVLAGASTIAGQTCDSKVTVWGLGVQQNIDAASMQVYLSYKNYSFEGNGFNPVPATNANGGLNGFSGGVHDLQSITVGTKIDF